VPIPALAEVQVALESAVAEVTQLQGHELKRVLRTGTVASTDNRNWELLPDNSPSAVSARAGRLRWTWKARRLPPTDFASGCPTARCCA
jgi:hypothetical protein